MVSIHSQHRNGGYIIIVLYIIMYISLESLVRHSPHLLLSRSRKVKEEPGIEYSSRRNWWNGPTSR